MEITSLNSLIRDTRQDNLYNLFDPTFVYDETFSLEKFIVGEEQMGRIDLVSNEIYENVNRVDFLLNLNNIDNPLNIMKGDEIIFTSEDSISYFEVRIPEEIGATTQLTTQNKSTRKDNNRQKYVENNFSLPPTLKRTPSSPVKIEENQIVIG